ncbi:MAG: Smr/MutS family protein [Acidobacteriota bacterium]
MLEQITLVPLIEDPVQPLIERLTQGVGALLGQELIRLAEALAVPREVQSNLQDSDIDAPMLRATFASDPEVDEYCERIKRCLDRRGRVRDDASPKLEQLRRQIQRLREKLYRSLQRTLDENEDYFSETTISLKDGRLNLLLNAGAKGRRQGIIHGRSGTGQSFYFEPIEAVEGNNALQEALEAETEERQRILNQLIDEARANANGIRSQLALLADLDALQSVCRFADIGDCIVPVISEGDELRLLQARHPLLDPAFAELRERALGTTGHTAPVVPLDLDLHTDERVLVITGPNAGGKTVALKTAGLLALIAQCGLPIPAVEGSSVSVFQSVMAMVGDEQDLLTDRSTFSARLLRLKEAWEVAGAGSLVLLDELGSGTDPEEGAALAIALLEGLLEHRGLAVITTHLTQLSAVALEKEGAVCAAMEFDPESGEPTYRLRPGAPGASEALALAHRLGLPAPWLERAEALLGSEHRDLARLLQEVETVRRELAETQGRLASEARALEQERLELASEVEQVIDERKRQQQVMRRQLDEFRRKVTEQLRDELETMRRKVDQGRRRNLVADSISRLFEEAPETEESEAEEGTLKVGGMARHRSLRWEGVLDKVKDGEAEIRVGGKKLKCRVEDLVPIGQDRATEDAGRASGIQIEVGDVATDADQELNLLGYRVEPALEEIDRYLDRALLSDRREVRIVHGFGSGRLRRAVRSHLEPHPAVESFRAGKQNEGGDGATVVLLDKK